MERRVNVITLVVAELEASRAFYADGLGWTPLIEAPDEVVMFQVGEKLVLSLWAEGHALDEIGPVQRGGTAPFTIAYNCSSEDEVDRALADAAEAGATVMAAQKRDWGGYSGYFADPDGFLWEVAFSPFPVGGLTLP